MNSQAANLKRTLRRLERGGMTPLRTKSLQRKVKRIAKKV